MSAHRFAPTSTPGTTYSCAARAMWFICGTLRSLARRDAAYKAIRSGRQKDRLAGNLTDSNYHCRPSWRNAREKTWKPRSAYKNGDHPQSKSRSTVLQRTQTSERSFLQWLYRGASTTAHAALGRSDKAMPRSATKEKQSHSTKGQKPHPSPQNQVVRNLSEIAYLMNEVNKRTQRRRQMPVTGIVEA